jgi:hypothetical protein
VQISSHNDLKRASAASTSDRDNFSPLSLHTTKWVIKDTLDVMPQEKSEMRQNDVDSRSVPRFHFVGTRRSFTTNEACVLHLEEQAAVDIWKFFGGW